MEKLRILYREDFEKNPPTQNGIYYSHQDCCFIEPVFEMKNGNLTRVETGYFNEVFSVPTKKFDFSVYPEHVGFYYTIRHNYEAGWHAYFTGKEWIGNDYGDNGWLYPAADMTHENTRQEILSNMEQETLFKILASCPVSMDKDEIIKLMQDYGLMQ